MLAWLSEQLARVLDETIGAGLAIIDAVTGTPVHRVPKGQGKL